MDTKKGTYDIQVFSYNAAGKYLQVQVATFTAEGKTATPEDVQNLTIEPINEQFVRLRFTQSSCS